MNRMAAHEQIGLPTATAEHYRRDMKSRKLIHISGQPDGIRQLHLWLKSKNFDLPIKSFGNFQADNADVGADVPKHPARPQGICASLNHMAVPHATTVGDGDVNIQIRRFHDKNGATRRRDRIPHLATKAASNLTW